MEDDPATYFQKMAHELRTMLREVERQRDEAEERAARLAMACDEIILKTLHDYAFPNPAYVVATRLASIAQDALSALPAELLARHAADQAIIRAATEYRQVNAILDSEPEPHPDPLARTILIEIGEQKQAALFAAVDGVGEGAKDG